MARWEVVSTVLAARNSMVQVNMQFGLIAISFQVRHRRHNYILCFYLFSICRKNLNSYTHTARAIH